MEIHVKSNKETNEDELCELHTEVCRNLNAMDSGKVLYSGESREKLLQLRHRIEKLILSGDVTWFSLRGLHSAHYKAIK